MGLTSDFADVINDAGHWILLRQAILDRPCSCMSSEFGASGDCPLCNGSGYMYIDNIMLARKSVLRSGVEQSAGPGIMSVPMYRFYLQEHVSVTHHDWILELQTNPSTLEPQIPYNVTAYWDIQDVNPLRGELGELIYYDCLAERSTWNVLA